jgi:hypothetical protein
VKASLDSKTENKSAKEGLIPAELGSTVEELKKLIKVICVCKVWIRTRAPFDGSGVRNSDTYPAFLTFGF